MRLWSEQFGLPKANSARQLLLGSHVLGGQAAGAASTRGLGQFISEWDIRIKLVGTAQQIGHSSTDVYRTRIVGIERGMVALHESRGSVPLCRRPHCWMSALVINRYGEDSSL